MLAEVKGLALRRKKGQGEKEEEEELQRRAQLCSASGLSVRTTQVQQRKLWRVRRLGFQGWHHWHLPLGLGSNFQKHESGVGHTNGTRAYIKFPPTIIL